MSRVSVNHILLESYIRILWLLGSVLNSDSGTIFSQEFIESLLLTFAMLWVWGGTCNSHHSNVA